MKFLLVNFDYGSCLSWFLERHPGFADRSYAEQMRLHAESFSSVTEACASALRALGHDAWAVIANLKPAQKAWAREQGLPPGPETRWTVVYRRGWIPWLRRLRDRWMFDILAEQARRYRPDVLLVQNMILFPARFIERIRRHVGFVVGQHAATPLPARAHRSAYDLVVSSFPPTVDLLRKRGVPAVLQRLGFDPAVVPRLEDGPRRHDVSFVGSFSPQFHRSREALLAEICRKIPQTSVWAPNAELLPDGSPVRERIRGTAFGLEMYQVLRDSRLTINHHGDILPHANNMRLYEATGVGTLLLTDWKEDLRKMFEPEREVVTYRSPAECVDRIRYYLSHPDEAASIARAGQARTLKDHTYPERMRELAGLVESRMADRGRS